MIVQGGTITGVFKHAEDAALPHMLRIFIQVNGIALFELPSLGGKTFSTFRGDQITQISDLTPYNDLEWVIGETIDDVLTDSTRTLFLRLRSAQVLWVEDESMGTVVRVEDSAYASAHFDLHSVDCDA